MLALKIGKKAINKCTCGGCLFNGGPLKCNFPELTGMNIGCDIGDNIYYIYVLEHRVTGVFDKEVFNKLTPVEQFTLLKELSITEEEIGNIKDLGFPERYTELRNTSY